MLKFYPSPSLRTNIVSLDRQDRFLEQFFGTSTICRSFLEWILWISMARLFFGGEDGYHGSGPSAAQLPLWGGDETKRRGDGLPSGNGSVSWNLSWYMGILWYILSYYWIPYCIYICISHFPLDPILRSGKRISSIKKLVGVDPRSDHESMVDWRITSSIPRW